LPSAKARFLRGARFFLSCMIFGSFLIEEGSCFRRPPGAFVFAVCRGILVVPGRKTGLFPYAGKLSRFFLWILLTGLASCAIISE
jgi:hypothetical protein